MRKENKFDGMHMVLTGLAICLIGIIIGMVASSPFVVETREEAKTCLVEKTRMEVSLKDANSRIQLHDSIVANLTLKLNNATNQTNRCLNTIAYIDQNIPGICNQYIIQQMAEMGMLP